MTTFGNPRACGLSPTHPAFWIALVFALLGLVLWYLIALPVLGFMVGWTTARDSVMPPEPIADGLAGDTACGEG